MDPDQPESGSGRLEFVVSLVPKGEGPGAPMLGGNARFLRFGATRISPGPIWRIGPA